MKRNVSSGLSGLFKFLPVALLSLFGFVTVCLFLSDFAGKSGASDAQNLKWVFLILTVVLSALILPKCAPLKEVSIDEQNLYVSNYFNEIAIPFADVSDVTENIWWNFHPVTVHLKRRSVFGDKIIFMPEQALLWFGGSHPVVSQLKRLAGLEES
jgi:hypothetical protein